MNINTDIIRNITTTHRSEIIDAIREAEENSYTECYPWSVIVSTSGEVNVFPNTHGRKLFYNWGDGFAEISVYTADNLNIDVIEAMDYEETEEDAIRSLIDNIDMEAELDAIEARIETAIFHLEQEEE